MIRCPQCGSENPDRAKFCLECATRLASAPSRTREVRKTVTVVFSDITGSTALGERLDPESLRALMSRYFDQMRVVLERHGGTVEKFIGDAVMAVFGIPHIHEDDALRAVRAADEMRTALAHLNEQLQGERGVTISTRTGVNTGEVVAGEVTERQSLVTGDPVNTAARLEQAAAPGEILLGDATYRLVRDAVSVLPLEPLSAKGKSQPLAAYRLLSVRRSAEGRSRRLDSPLVGRGRELDRLRDAFDDAVRERRCQLFTLLGAAGVGKSRLVAEFTRSLGDAANILRGRCLPYGEGITYWPLREVVTAAAGIEEGDDRLTALDKLSALVAADREGELVALRVAQSVGLDVDPAPQEELFWGVRKLLEALARRQPLVVEFDDIQWAEPTFLELIEHVADWSRDAPILLLCPARPELLDARPTWGGGKLNATTLLLEPLAAEAAGLLIKNLVAGAALPSAVTSRITEAAEGNPLFVEQMLGMLMDERLLERDGDGWRVSPDLVRLPVPPTISALLAARLDRLPPDERAVAERAAVVGRIFERGAVSELSPEGHRPEVPRHLMSLVRRELVRPDATGVDGGEAFRFRHLLIRDAAYEALPKTERAELHERFAYWLERSVGDRLFEYEGVVGHHLEQAYRYCVELGTVDGRTEVLARQAGERIAAAGRHALEREDYSAAAALLTRADELLGLEFAVEALLDLGDTFSQGGRYQDALRTYERAMKGAAAEGRRDLEIRARLRVVDMQAVVEPAAFTLLTPTATAALPELEQLGDSAGLAHAELLLGRAHGDAMRYAEALESFDRAVEHARGARDLPLERRASGMAALALVNGPMPAQQAAERCDAALAEVTSRRTRALLLTTSGCLLAMRGETLDAQQRFLESEMLLEELGAPGRLAVAATFSGSALRASGDHVAAEARFRRAYSLLESIGEASQIYATAGCFAHLLVDLDRDSEAEAFVATASASDASNVEPQVHWRTARARMLLKRGELDEALQLTLEAKEIIDRTDALVHRGDAALVLAQILAAAGRAADAVGEAAEALRLYASKGHLVLAGKAQELLADHDHASSTSTS